ncbi:MAG: UDP-2,3-diacylglucosamine diphosphatase [Bacteroidales bacterium]|nr:UDP-2,3-diacylglucosamine diphosphatase [Bacteroidales bacterium]MCF8327090.1 UDP-2,3-diacylglucosamine diphosphatase [Bacteroidales bacterium]
MQESNNIYFLSDAHLGAPDHKSSLARERKLVDWLEQIAPDAKAIFLLGDIFDFWFEYKHVVPRGYTRLLGTIARITDQGIPVHFFAGNHDLWIKDYFEKESGMQLHHQPFEFEFKNKRFYIAHGDGLGKGDTGYKLLKKVFTCKLCQWLFARLHPNFAVGIARYFSRRSRVATNDDEVFSGEENEFLVLHAKELLKQKHIDYFVFGHRHLPLKIKLSKGSMYFNLGEWFNQFTYGVFDGEKLQLKYYNKTGDPAVNQEKNP